jgi:uncharacterized protein
MKRVDVLRVLKEYHNQCGEKYGILKLGVFGSFATETSKENSDLDIVVTIREQDLFNLIGIKQDLETQFHTTVDIVSYRPRMNPF